MGLDAPLASLHIASSANIEQNALVLGKLRSTFKGDSDHITSYNATHISTGSMGPDRLFGYYPTIAGTGTIQTGQWQSPSIIQDSYISNSLSLNSSTLLNPTLEGTLTLSPELSFINKNAPFNIHSKNWTLSQHSRIATLNTQAITMNATALLYNHHLQIPIIYYLHKF